MAKEEIKFSDLLKNDQAYLAKKALDYFDGDQQKHLIALMNTPGSGRKDWQTRGIIPRTRNILRMIIEKSGLLFADKEPKMEVYSSMEATDVDETQTETLAFELDKAGWVEYFTNFDSSVRLLKTGLTLVQFDVESDSLVFDALTRNNSAVVMSRNNKKIEMLVYKTSSDEDELEEYRVFTNELIQDIKVNPETGEEFIFSTVPNPFGIIPVAEFHDTNTPRANFWNVIPHDLVQINDVYNLHITDSEFAASWSKLKTLFTNCKIKTSEDMQFDEVVIPGSPLPRMAPSQGALIGGPSSVIQIDTIGVDSPFVEYKGPEVNLLPIDEMINKWVADFAADWAVNVKFGGDGAADSGFKLIVEEMPNLELRKKRAKMFERGFERLFAVIRRVVNTYKPGTFSEEAVLAVKFFDPVLPVDQKVQEDVWSRRIAEKRATRVDYFMAVYGMTKEEAENKVLEIDAAVAPEIGVKKVSVGL